MRFFPFLSQSCRFYRHLGRFSRSIVAFSSFFACGLADTCCRDLAGRFLTRQLVGRSPGRLLCFPAGFVWGEPGPSQPQAIGLTLRRFLVCLGFLLIIIGVDRTDPSRGSFSAFSCPLRGRGPPGLVYFKSKGSILFIVSQGPDLLTPTYRREDLPPFPQGCECGAFSFG